MILMTQNCKKNKLHNPLYLTTYTEAINDAKVWKGAEHVLCDSRKGGKAIFETTIVVWSKVGQQYTPARLETKQF